MTTQASKQLVYDPDRIQDLALQARRERSALIRRTIKRLLRGPARARDDFAGAKPAGSAA